MKDGHEYVLGTHDAELTRLGLQHRLWSEFTFACWRRCGIRPGAVVLDVGSGPGYTAFDLIPLIGPSGRVVAVDESERFIDYIRSRASSLDIENIETHVADVQEMSLSAASVDIAYARWVLCFVPRPEAVIERVAHALKPGGVFAVQDYINWAALTLSPKSDAFLRVMPSIGKSWRERGGDPQVGQRLPALMAAAGLEVLEIRPLQRIARPADPLWEWPTTFFSNFIPMLVQQGLVTKEDWEDFQSEWRERTGDPNAVFWTPSMVEIIARRPVSS
jgi:ubiquinone/menaquinone biosynthesis C-methylase UbiE